MWAPTFPVGQRLSRMWPVPVLCLQTMVLTVFQFITLIPLYGGDRAPLVPRFVDNFGFALEFPTLINVSCAAHALIYLWRPQSCGLYAYMAYVIIR